MRRAPAFLLERIQTVGPRHRRSKTDPMAIRGHPPPTEMTAIFQNLVDDVTQPTETVMSTARQLLRAISRTCRELGRNLHMTGARWPTPVPPSVMRPSRHGHGGRARCSPLLLRHKKNGMAAGKPSVFKPKAREDFDCYRCKQAGHWPRNARCCRSRLGRACSNLSVLRNATWQPGAQRLLRKSMGVRKLDNIMFFPVQQCVSCACRMPLEPPRSGIELAVLTFIVGGARFCFALIRASRVKMNWPPTSFHNRAFDLIRRPWTAALNPHLHSNEDDISLPQLFPPAHSSADAQVG